MKLWLEKAGGQGADEVKAGDQVRRRCLLGNTCIFEDVSNYPSPTITTSAGRRIWLEDE